MLLEVEDGLGLADGTGVGDLVPFVEDKGEALFSELGCFVVKIRFVSEELFEGEAPLEESAESELVWFGMLLPEVRYY